MLARAFGVCPLYIARPIHPAVLLVLPHSCSDLGRLLHGFELGLQGRGSQLTSSTHRGMCPATTYLESSPDCNVLGYTAKLSLE
eukprot:1094563-Amphidinium_carterae.1